ncbi:hypothetical protein RRG08_040721 [Elysia crispata]|uniref:Uncharacterized protein n=1 Tax=Elysia crispata TaxID=231223 RepID=A0AAE1EEW9_9GAST|nr:hypothetical protein RRG08_040721 [Elysia crispata]
MFRIGDGSLTASLATLDRDHLSSDLSLPPIVPPSSNSLAPPAAAPVSVASNLLGQRFITASDRLGHRQSSPQKKSGRDLLT